MMGFEEDKFVSRVDPDKKCHLCRGVLDNPLLTTCCKRIFCAGCALPMVIQEGKCPSDFCTSSLTSSDLENVLDLRHSILNMSVKCDFVARGCKEVVLLADLPKHLGSCSFRPVSCSNQGCAKTMDYKNLLDHERESCDFRPFGICQDGCGLVILQHEANRHSCLDALRGHISLQELTVCSLGNEIRKISSKFCNMERGLLLQISKLHGEIQNQTLKFDKKIEEYKTQILELSKIEKYRDDEKETAESRLEIILSRSSGSLGFNIMGGSSPSSETKEGIMVSKVTEGSQAVKRGIQVMDQILKVNGEDLSHSTHEQAVEAFQNAHEPIVVEVLRRVSSKTTPTKMRTRSPPMVTVSTQTDEYIEDAYFSLIGSPNSADINGFSSSVPPASRQGVAFSGQVDNGLTDIDGLEYDDEYDAERAFEVEYEEVSLHRTSSTEKIGLTLCYGSTDEDGSDTCIFIGEVDPYSIAGHDGRIREGDQILQISGVDVYSRDQAIHLFSENRSEISLLLARPQILPMDDGFLEERSGLDALHALDALDAQHHDLRHLLPQGNDEEGGTTDTATTENSAKHEKDSGVGRTDESTKNDESSEQEMLENECGSPSPSNHHQLGGLAGPELRYSNDSFTSTDAHDADRPAPNDIAAEECDKFREVLETRCGMELCEGGSSSSMSSTSSPPPLPPARGSAGSSSGGSPSSSSAAATTNGHHNHHLPTPPPRKDSQSNIEREIALLNHEMEQIQIECQEIVEAHAREQHKVRAQTDAAKASAEPFRSPRLVPRMGTRLDYIKQLHSVQEQQEPVWLKQSGSSPPTTTASSSSPPCPPGAPSPADSLRKSGGAGGERDTSTTSAYNTGDSCRSTPLTLELHQNSEDSGRGHHNHSMLSLATVPAGAVSSGSGKLLSHSDSEKLPGASGSGHSATGGKEWSSDGDARLRNAVCKSGSSTSVSRMSQTQDPENAGSLQQLYSQYADVMYTNHANLQHTIMVQQKLFQQQIMQRAKHNNNNSTKKGPLVSMAIPPPPDSQPPTLPHPPPPPHPATQTTPHSSPQKPSTSSSGTKSQEGSPKHKHSSSSSPSSKSKCPAVPHSPVTPCPQTPNSTLGGGSGAASSAGNVSATGVQMEWVVKRRADGSRYITRRPVRNKMLKERARKLNEERCGMTTDDDAVSEMKVGRYWSKEDRKGHLEKAREHRKKKEILMKQRMETLKEHDETKANNIVEMSNRKMMKHKGKKVLDDFTTVQEMLAHGSREGPQGKSYNPLLSVTTV